MERAEQLKPPEFPAKIKSMYAHTHERVVSVCAYIYASHHKSAICASSACVTTSSTLNEHVNARDPVAKRRHADDTSNLRASFYSVIFFEITYAVFVCIAHMRTVRGVRADALGRAKRLVTTLPGTASQELARRDSESEKRVNTRA